MDQIIKNSQGETLEYTFHAGQENARNLLIVGHGVTGNKDRPFVVALAEAVSAEGLPVLRFSFSGNGGSEGCLLYTSPSPRDQRGSRMPSSA